MLNKCFDVRTDPEKARKEVQNSPSQQGRADFRRRIAPERKGEGNWRGKETWTLHSARLEPDPWCDSEKHNQGG